MDTPLQHTYGPKHFFELMAERPDVLTSFQLLMTSYREGRPGFLDIYPVDERLIKGVSNKGESVLFIDIGGGHGHETQSMIRKFPEAPGRKILQEVCVLYLNFLQPMYIVRMFLAIGADK